MTSAIHHTSKKKHPRSARIQRPAPWEYPPKADAGGIRHSGAILHESEQFSLTMVPEAPIVDPVRGLKTGPYDNNLWMGDHLKEGADGKDRRKGKKFNPRMNFNTEQEDLGPDNHGEGLRTGIRPEDHCEIPWISGPPPLPSNARRSYSYAQPALPLPREFPASPRPLRQPGKCLSHEARVMSCFEQGTCLRRHAPVPPDYRSCSPFGTAYNAIPNEPLRKHTVHYDTRELLTYR